MIEESGSNVKKGGGRAWTNQIVPVWSDSKPPVETKCVCVCVHADSVRNRHFTCVCRSPTDQRGSLECTETDVLLTPPGEATAHYAPSISPTEQIRYLTRALPLPDTPSLPPLHDSDRWGGCAPQSAVTGCLITEIISRASVENPPCAKRWLARPPARPPMIL